MAASGQRSGGRSPEPPEDPVGDEVGDLEGQEVSGAGDHLASEGPTEVARLAGPARGVRVGTYARANATVLGAMQMQGGHGDRRAGDHYKETNSLGPRAQQELIVPLAELIVGP